MAKGVTDNVPTRTRLRLVLEHGGYDTNGEFDITPLCRHMWDELNHPLEMFGELKFKSAHEAKVHANESSGLALAFKSSLPWRAAFNGSSISYLLQHNDAPIVPFVFMVYKRVDLLKMAMDSLRASDFDRKHVPLIISHDGHVPEVVSYVEHLKSDFRVVQLFHPYSCYDHPNTFPGNDESLNENYAGDLYGNVRNGTVTCCKHHFTWMIKTVFSMANFGPQVDAFAFFEEDYIVSPTIYESVVSGLTLLKTLSHQNDSFFGIVMEGSVFNNNYATEGWHVKNFISGPMALTRRTFESLVDNARDFCTYDDYNWDWSIVHLMNKGLLPSRVLYPTIPQTMHVGSDDGMHGGTAARWQLFAALNAKFPGPFHGTKLIGETTRTNQKVRKNKKVRTNQNVISPFGGWGHPADHKHCIELLSGATVAH
jgi:alpha-1,6-mannosyl-glycoprotein beta-1,2-N-acetylglucosaminyltransferase